MQAQRLAPSGIAASPADSRPAAALALRIVLALAFIAAAATYAAGIAPPAGPAAAWLALAAAFGAYMALNIGANDVANNIGPLVGARIMPVTAALIMAAVMEAAGAIIAGGEVVGTIRRGIVAPTAFADIGSYVWAMMAALLAAAIWLNLATSVGAPVSTTHSIVGGVLGAGIAAAGFGIVDWAVMGAIAASWVVSPVMGAVLAALALFLVRQAITGQDDILTAARQGVPVLGAAMCWAFATYLMVKGLSKVIDLTFPQAALIGLIPAAATWAAMRAHVARRLPALRNCKSSVNRLLAIPLVLAAGALSFAHGSNDVANAIGPLAGIVGALSTGQTSGEAAIPIWVMVMGGAGLAIGLLMFGPRVIRTIGSELTRLDATRAYCIAMAATLTVMLASQLGLPVSTTHVTVGAVLGVGFMRERLRRLDPAANTRRAGLVNRRLMLRIFAAWLITVPATAILAALSYFTLRGMMLP